MTLEQKTNPERLTRFQRGTLLKRVSDFFRITIAAQPREIFWGPFLTPEKINIGGHAVRIDRPMTSRVRGHREKYERGEDEENDLPIP